MLEALDAHPREQRARAAGSTSAGSLARTSHAQPRPVPRGELDRLRRAPTARVVGRRCRASSRWRRGAPARESSAPHERLQVGERARLGEGRLVHRHLEPLLERHQQLDALERAQPQFVERRRRRSSGGPPRDEARHDLLQRRAARPVARAACGCAAAVHPRLDLAPLQLARALGARQLVAGPDRHAADLLVIAELRVGVADDRVRDRRRARAPAPRARAPRRRAARPTTAASRTPGTSSSARSTSSGKTFSPSGVTIISFLRPLM